MRGRGDESGESGDETALADTLLTLDQPSDGAASDAAGHPARVAAAASTAVVAPPTSTSPRGLALRWVDETTIGTDAPAADLSAASSPYIPVDVDLLVDAPRRSPLRAGVVVPTLITVGLVGAYAATTLLWPLHAVTPTISAIQVQPAAAPATAPVWPTTGSAAISVAGMPGVIESAPDAQAIASITKLVTALAVLDEMPLAVGEEGPAFRFTANDRAAYRNYKARGESALDVPVGGSLSQYQLLEGMLIGSANNYADRLAGNIWPSDAVYASAANSWLTAHGVPGVTVVEPTGFDADNTASAASLIPLAQKALANPVIAEIVAKQSVELPGAGVVQNTNGLLVDPGVLGIKTGTLDAWNLLSAKAVPIGDTTVRLYAAVLGQPDDATRLAVSRALYAQLEAELQPRPSVTAGTVAGLVETAWGDPVDIVTADDASVILWNGGAGMVTSTYSLGDSRAAGDTVGSLSVDGPLNDTSVELRLADDIEEPSPWWRLTHPLELFGLTD
jgi:D-alanyl-D-alanine carboxypeptidase (penicillin-binding protein 5/6)